MINGYLIGVGNKQQQRIGGIRLKVQEDVRLAPELIGIVVNDGVTGSVKLHSGSFLHYDQLITLTGAIVETRRLSKVPESQQVHAELEILNVAPEELLLNTRLNLQL